LDIRPLFYEYGGFAIALLFIISVVLLTAHGLELLGGFLISIDLLAIFALLAEDWIMPSAQGSGAQQSP
jgi:hypothetical protein